MVHCIPVSVTFKRRWVLLLSLMCAVETEDDCFSYTCAVSGLVSKHFFRYRYRTDASSIGRYRVPDASIGLTLAVADDESLASNHGGIAVFFTSSLKCQQRDLPSLNTIEALMIRLCKFGHAFVLTVIYRLGSCKPDEQFFAELTRECS